MCLTLAGPYTHIDIVLFFVRRFGLLVGEICTRNKCISALVPRNISFFSLNRCNFALSLTANG